MPDLVVLAIDPGPTQSAWVRWNGAKILDHGIAANDHVLNEIVAEDSCWVDYIAIEQIASYGMPVGAEVFETCYWSGRFAERWILRVHKGSVIRIPRKEICVHLCGSARAKDANIRQALIDRLGAPGTKKAQGATYGIHADEWAALAVAVTAFDRLKCGHYTGNTQAA